AKLPYDTLKDFTEIAPLAIQPNVFVVTADSKYKTLMDFVSAAKAQPGSLNIGHAGVGSGTHLNTEKFIAAAKIKVTEVPFKGTPEVIAAMLSGDVPASRAPMRRFGSDCGDRRGCRRTSSRRSTPTCARRSPIRQ